MADNPAPGSTAAPRALDLAVVRDRLANLPGWQVDPQRPALLRSLRFRDFSQAFAFMTRVALVAERRQHHPEWFNVYQRVDIVLTTHDANGITDRDLAMAADIDRLAADFGA